MADPLFAFDLTKTVMAVGALGTAAYGFVDATKAFGGGGVSAVGFGDISNVVAKFIPQADGQVSALDLPSVLATLKANWMNGMALADQKSVAKALIKLNLTTATANTMAAATGVAAGALKSVATKLVSGAALSPEETDAYGRFDLLLSALLDQGYQRGDQRYRNRAKLLAIPVAVVLAVAGALAVYGRDISHVAMAVVAGFVATPLAPVAKDLASAIQAGVQVAQTWKK